MKDHVEIGHLTKGAFVWDQSGIRFWQFCAQEENSRNIFRNTFLFRTIPKGTRPKYDAFRMNRDQVMDLEIWLQIHTNVFNFETASSQII